jgi:hypothetical protein
MAKIGMFLALVLVGCGGPSFTVGFKEIDQADSGPQADALAAAGGVSTVASGGKAGLSAGGQPGSGGAGSGGASSGGMPSSGGLSGSGGAVDVDGGHDSGGASSVGGSVATGGVVGSGGVTGTGGSVGSGGSSVGDGGVGCATVADCPAAPLNGVEQCVARQCVLSRYGPGCTSVQCGACIAVQCEACPLAGSCCRPDATCGCVFGSLCR